MSKQESTELIFDPQKMSRRAFLTWLSIAGGSFFTLGLTAELAYFADQLQRRQPQTATDIPKTPTATVTATKTSTPTPTITKDIPTPVPLDNYRLEKINLRGNGSFEKDKLQPAPDLKGKITLEGGRIVEFSVAKPIARVPGDNEATMYNWDNPFTKSYLNSEKFGADFIIQVGHTGTYRDEKGISHLLPAENLRRAFEANSRPFTPTEFKNTVEAFQKAKVSLTQDKTIVEAKVRTIIRLGPKETKELAEIYATSGADRDILKFAKLNIQLDPKKEFALLICGQNFFPGETATPKVKPYLQTRYFIFFTLL